MTPYRKSWSQMSGNERTEKVTNWLFLSIVISVAGLSVAALIYIAGSRPTISIPVSSAPPEPCVDEVSVILHDGSLRCRPTATMEVRVESDRTIVTCICPGHSTEFIWAVPVCQESQ